jgi:nitrogen regulatory protein PII
MIRIDIVIPQNDVEAISEALKKIKVGGITILKVKGRGKSIVTQYSCFQRNRDVYTRI